MTISILQQLTTLAPALCSLMQRTLLFVSCCVSLCITGVITGQPAELQGVKLDPPNELIPWVLASGGQVRRVL